MEVQTRQLPRQNTDFPPAFRANIWKPGQSGNPKGRPLGSRSVTILERAETKIAKKYVALTLSEQLAIEEQGRLLRHAMDKYVPDAGKDQQVENPFIVIAFGASAQIPLAPQPVVSLPLQNDVLSVTPCPAT